MRKATRLGLRPVAMRGTILPPINSALPGERNRSSIEARACPTLAMAVAPWVVNLARPRAIIPRPRIGETLALAGEPLRKHALPRRPPDGEGTAGATP